MPHVYGDRREKLTDFWLGFAGWFLINGIAVGLLVRLVGPGGSMGQLLLLLNVGAPLGLLFLRPLVSLGILLAFANLLAAVVMVGIFETPADFTAFSGSGTNPATLFVGFGLLGLAAFGTGSFFVMRTILRRL